jgi:hypothetical protein
MSDFELRLGEELLKEAPVLYRRGILAHGGTASLTDRRFHFEPKSLDKLAGAKAITIELLEVKKVARNGVDGILEISMPGVVHRLMGDSTKEFEQAIKAAIKALDQAALIGNRLHQTYAEQERRRAQAEEDRLRREAEQRERDRMAREAIAEARGVSRR